MMTTKQTLFTIALLALRASADVLPAPLLYTTWKPADAKDPLVVQTEAGPVKGFYSHLTYRGSSNDMFKANTPRSFLGIPFAEPPVGKNRFRDPQPYSAPWKGKLRYAKLNAPACPQKWKSIQNEDCLYLNVFTPPIERIRKARGGLPVMFWLHGGGFTVGSSKQFSIYDGRYMAEKHDVILVTANYRLGILGYLATEAQGEAVNGNFGIKDQLAALKWVGRNIHHFGGDASRITLFGQSAGATSVLMHLVSPATPPSLVHSAIIMSPPMVAHSKTNAEMLQIGINYAKNVSCTTTTATSKVVADMDCLRRMSVKDVLGSQMPIYNSSHPVGDVEYWWPHVDGKILHKDLFQLLEQGQMKRVPLIMGWMRDEMGWMTLGADTPVLSLFKDGHKQFEEQALTNFVQYSFRDKASAILSHFPVSKTDIQQNERVVVDVGTDYMFRCSTNYIAQRLAAHGHKLYLYEFQRVQKMPLGRCYKDMACHAFELWYLWRPFWYQFSPKENKFSDGFIDLFTGFASGKMSRAWPAYKPKGTIMVMKDGFSTSSSAFVQDRCAFWDKQVGYYKY